MADLKDVKIGAQAGTTSLTFITDVIQPDAEPFVYDDNVGAKAALEANQIDAIVVDLPTAMFITAVEIEGSKVVGQFPPAGRRHHRRLRAAVREGQPARRVRQRRAGRDCATRASWT